MIDLTHLDITGKAKMVDVSNKPIQKRLASAKGKIIIAKETLDLINKNLLKKGDVLAIAQLAGIQAAKRTAELIPLCHTLVLDKVALNFELGDNVVIAYSEVICIGRTGAEMEALTAVTVALLTIYDMCKAVDKNMRMEDIKLLEKKKEML
jgi:cyclic pyranopterin monophosphate synthase